MAETRDEYLRRTSEMYRRLSVMPERRVPAIDLARDAPPPDSARAVPQAVKVEVPQAVEVKVPQPGPGFVRRMFTRRVDGREIVLLGLVVLALWFVQH